MVFSAEEPLATSDVKDFVEADVDCVLSSVAEYPVHVGNNKGKKANFRRKCQAFTIQDDCLKYVHKPNRQDITEVRFLRVIKDRQYQLDIVLASHRGSGYSDESVALGGHVGREKVIDRIMQRYWWRKIVSDVNETQNLLAVPKIKHNPPSPTSLSEPPSPIVQIIGVQQQEIIHKFNPITVATQRAICNNSGGRLILKKKSGPSGKINKTFKNTSEPLAVKVIKGDGNCFFRSMAFAITGEEDQHPIVRSLICDFLSTNENIQVDSMREDKVWGTTTEIIAAANMFQVNVCVWAKFGSIHTWHIHSPKGSKIIKDSVYLENNAGNNFNVVIRV
ncbi:uncharacterized protein LOC143037290 [Oratosquilla oratoria]|uniref:uncharacterized protein LOC143037290 n=1 Tax=Oratosquilla oratoria TaxID=337810 RepID=UPI003F761FF1